MEQTTRTFVFISIIVSVLLLMHNLPTLSINDVELRGVNVLDDIIKTPGTKKETDVLSQSAPQKPIIAKVKNNKGEEFKPTNPKNIITIDDYSQGEIHGMDKFYEALLAIKLKKNIVRVAYFGDSFIEGDILTCNLREQLQTQFGGEGVGWIDVGSELNKGFRRTIQQKYNGITEYAAINKSFNSNIQGINQCYSIASNGASVKTNGTNFMPHSSSWNVSQLFFKSPNGFNLNAKIDGKGEQNYVVAGSNALQSIRITGKTNEIKYVFNNINYTTTLYGMALEGTQGVVLDNYSMRGSSGLMIGNVPLSTMKEFAKKRPIDLFILHFGLNVVHPKNDNANYRTYINKMSKVINKIKEAYPQASILIISVPDRNQRASDGTITTMKGVETLLFYQQQMASNNKIAFFNLFKAMGGVGSMSKLVEQNKANKDYTHINSNGGKVLATYIYDAIKLEFDNYKRRKEWETQ